MKESRFDFLSSSAGFSEIQVLLKSQNCLISGFVSWTQLRLPNNVKSFKGLAPSLCKSSWVAACHRVRVILGSCSVHISNQPECKLCKYQHLTVNLSASLAHTAIYCSVGECILECFGTKLFNVNLSACISVWAKCSRACQGQFVESQPTTGLNPDRSKIKLKQLRGIWSNWESGLGL